VNGRISALLELGAGFNRIYRKGKCFHDGATGINGKMEERFDRIADLQTSVTSWTSRSKPIPVVCMSDLPLLQQSMLTLTY
jgi:hypothetical protein